MDHEWSVCRDCCTRCGVTGQAIKQGEASRECTGHEPDSFDADDRAHIWSQLEQVARQK